MGLGRGGGTGRRSELKIRWSVRAVGVRFPPSAPEVEAHSSTEAIKVETLKVVRKTFTMLSEKRTQVLDITKQIRDIVLGADIKEGIILVNSLHTTCALFVNEFQGALVDDLKTMMERLVADNAGYKHDDPRFSDCERGNATSHLRAALLGRSVAVGISGGELSLGRFQSILFAELDGPRPRSIDIQIMGVGPVGGN